MSATLRVALYASGRDAERPDVRCHAPRGNENNRAAKTPQDQTMLQRQLDATDRQIDRLVYELYGLTDAEIQIVGAAKP
jgi:hypothetical protein